MTCTNCTFSPPCQTRSQMQARHGTPREFDGQLRWSYDSLMISKAEMDAASLKYRDDWTVAEEDRIRKMEGPKNCVACKKEYPEDGERLGWAYLTTSPPCIACSKACFDRFWKGVHAL